MSSTASTQLRGFSSLSDFTCVSPQVLFQLSRVHELVMTLSTFWQRFAFNKNKEYISLLLEGLLIPTCCCRRDAHLYELCNGF